MNRKLVNGLLLLSIATVGCGTFTSCKDTDDDVQAGYNKELASMYDDLIKKINEAACKCEPSVQADLNALATWLGGTYNAATGEFTFPNSFDDKVLANLKDALDTDDLAQIIPALQNVQAQLNKQITSMELNQTYNPVFGTLNLPIGLQSNILAGYYGTSDKAFNFPDFSDEMAGHEVGMDEAQMLKAHNLWAAANLNPTTEPIPAGVYMADNGYLGKAYLTINPVGTLTSPKLELIKSTGALASEGLTLATEATNDELKFGITRADFNNGLYKATASIDPNKAGDIAIKLNSDFKNAVVDIFKNPSRKTLSDLGEALYNQLNGILPAYGFKAAYDASSFSFVYDEVTKKWTVAAPTATTSNYIVSKYELAATTIHPLGYNSMKDLSTSKRLPTFSPIQDALNEVIENIKKDAQFNFADNIKWEFDEEKMKITIDLSKVEGIELNGGDGILVLGYKNGVVTPEDGNAAALNPLVDELISQVNEQLKAIQGNINQQVETIINNVNNQLAGKISTAQKLLDKYNALANKINAYLADPHGHMQVAMAYEGTNGLHMLSTSENDPSIFTSNGSAEEAIELFATSYTGDIAAPSFKKYVAVVGASDGSNVASINNASKYLNTVISGRQHRVYLKDFKKGVKYTILYSSVDYRGNTSSRLYYLLVK